jgi:hypothetical protein
VVRRGSCGKKGGEMIKYKTIIVEQFEPEFIICDKCKKQFAIGLSADEYDIQEFHQIHFTGGYNSVFGDMADVQCDLCQHCLRELVGQFCRVDEEV